MTAHCPQEQISAWLDGQLEAQQAEQVDQHLRQCETCRRFQEELASAASLFRNMEMLEPPPHLWTRISANLEHPETRNSFAWLRQLYRNELMAVAAALALMIGGALFYIVQRHSLTHSEVATIAQIDNVGTTLIAKNPDVYNPFRRSVGTSPDSNPFARHQLSADSNPFGSIREKR